MNDATAPVAARIDAAELQTDANLHVQVGPATKRFHLWQQVPAWLLGDVGPRRELAVRVHHRGLLDRIHVVAGRGRAVRQALESDLQGIDPRQPSADD